MEDRAAKGGKSWRKNYCDYRHGLNNADFAEMIRQIMDYNDRPSF
jgi:hypothetical protein